MLEEHPASVRPGKRISLEPYAVQEAFQSRSYAQKYEEVCKRLVRELLYDAACFFTSDQKQGPKGIFRQPSEELSIRKFAVSLHARATAFARLST